MLELNEFQSKLFYQDISNVCLESTWFDKGYIFVIEFLDMNGIVFTLEEINNVHTLQ